MKIGLTTYALAWSIGVPGHPVDAPLDAIGVLKVATELGLEVVQLADNLPVHAMPGARRRALRRAARERGLTLELGARGLTQARLSCYLDLCHECEVSLLRFVIDAAGYEPAPAEVVAILRDAKAALADCGVCLAIENHDRFPARRLRDMIESVASEQIGACIDTANNLGSGEGIDTVLMELAPHCLNLHVKDVAIRRADHQMGFLVEGRPAGNGILDLPSLLRTVQSHGRCRSAEIELWPAPEPTGIAATVAKERTWLGQSVAALRAAWPGTR